MSVSIAIRPKYVTRRAADRVIYPNNGFIDIVEEQSARHLLSMLGTCFAAIVVDGKYYPVEVDNYAEQFKFATAGEALTVEAVEDFGVKKLNNFFSATESDVSAIQKDVTVANGVITGTVLKVVDNSKCAIEAVNKNGYWFCFKFDKEGAEAEGYSELALVGSTEALASGDVYLYLGANEEAASKAFITVAGKYTKGEETSDVSEAFDVRLSTLVVIANDDVPAIEVNGVAYSTLAAAFGALNKKGGTVTINKSFVCADTDKINLIDGKDYVLEIKNGVTLSLSRYIALKSGSLTVTGNGTLLEAPIYFGPIVLLNTDKTKSVKVTVGKNILLRGWAGLFFDKASYNLSADVYGTCVGGQEGDNGYGIYINGNMQDSTLNFYGSTAGTIGHGMYLAGKVNALISGAIVEATNVGIEHRAGSLTIENSKIKGGSGEPTMKANGNGTTSNNCAVAVAQHTTKHDIEVVVSGSTLTGGACFAEGNPQNNPDATKQTKLWLGAGKYNGLIKTFADTDCTKFIYGGHFNKEPDAKYLAKGYSAVVDSYGTYDVIKG